MKKSNKIAKHFVAKQTQKFKSYTIKKKWAQIKSNLFILSFLAFTLVSCSQNKKDKEVLEYNANMERLEKTKDTHKIRLEKIGQKKFNHGNLNMEMIKNEMKNCKSKNDVIKLWEKAGMTNAEEYFDSITEQFNEFESEIKNKPDMKSWNKDQIKDYVSKIVEPNKGLLKNKSK